MTDMPTDRQEPSPFDDATEPGRARRTRLAVLAAAGVCLVAVVVAACGGDERADVDSSGGVVGLASSEPRKAARSDPAAVIEDYRVAYNSGDNERVMALFADDAELTRHPFATSSTGSVAIRGVQLRDLSVAAPTNAYTFLNVEVSGDTVTWDHQFTNADGDRYCAEGNTAVVAAGKIESWAFAPKLRRC